jgi:ribosome-binding protein aMBF1 (putative translation factor)
MPGMLRKSAAFAPRYRKFEAISLQRRVLQTSGSSRAAAQTNMQHSRAELSRACKDAGVTQQQLADRIGKPQSFVSKYERGERRVDLVEFLAIAEALGLDPCRFIRDLKLNAKKKPRA